MTVISSEDMDRSKDNGWYDPRIRKGKWDDRVVIFLKHHYGLSRHKCTPHEALYDTHPFLKDMEHTVEVGRNSLNISSKKYPYWFSVEYFIATEDACHHCGGKMLEPKLIATPCHKCSNDKDGITVTCGAGRFTAIAVNKKEKPQ